MYNSDWKEYRTGESRGRRNKNWSKASLCFDITKFLKKYCEANNRISGVEIADVLEWVILREDDCSDGARNVYPLPTLWEESNRYLRLSELWRIGNPRFAEAQFKAPLRDILENREHNEQEIKNVLGPLCELMVTLSNVKYNTKVDMLRISRFDPNINVEEDYMDAIVNIFTRLNSAGTVLTKEDITFAWLKNTWPAIGREIERTVTEFGRIPIELKPNDIIRLIVFMWTVENRDNGEALNQRDLLRGNMISPIASFVRDNWSKYKESIDNVIEMIIDRGYDSRLASFNAIIVSISLYYNFYRKYATLNINEAERHNLLEATKNKFNIFIDRWLLGSEWATKWTSAGRLDNMGPLLRDDFTEMDSCSTEAISITLTDSMNKFLKWMNEDANNAVKDLYFAKTTKYFTYLWVWHRIGEERWNQSKTQIRSSRNAKFKIEVDHVIPVALWDNLIADKDDVAQAKIMTKALETFTEREKTSFEDFDCKTIINSIGNCVLLKKNFNISKGRKPMLEFIEQIDYFRDNNNFISWKQELYLTDSMLSPSDNHESLTEAIRSILKRELLIKKDLLDFIAGNNDRCDITN